jgi:hypothetical protein
MIKKRKKISESEHESVFIKTGEKKNRKSAANLKSFSNRQHFFILLEVLPQ